MNACGFEAIHPLWWDSAAPAARGRCGALEGPVPARCCSRRSPASPRAGVGIVQTRRCYALPACVLPYRDLLEPAMIDLMCGLPVGGPPDRQPVPSADCATLTWSVES